MRLKLHIDGASRGNPGPAGIGVVLQDVQGHTVVEMGEYLGETTNNVAEYRALLRGLDRARELGASQIEIYADSALLVKQLQGAYRVRSAQLAPLHARAKQALAGFSDWSITHVSRAYNAAADALANRAIDERAGALADGHGVDNLRRRLERLAAGLDGVMGVGIKSSWDGLELYLEPDRTFPTASVFKIPVLLELLLQAEEGRLSLDERVPVTEAAKSPGSGVLKELTSSPVLSLSDLAMLMVVISDNTATDILMGRVGIEAINRRLASWGFRVTRVAMDCRRLLFELAGRPGGPFTPEARLEVEQILRTRPRVFAGRPYADTENNVTTPREMIALLEMLVTEGRLPRSVREQALFYLRKQQVRDRLPLHLPPGTDIAHKTGSIAGVRNDAGVLFAPRGPVLVCAFTRDLKVDLDGAMAIAEVGRLVYEAFA
ncbi:MAG: serine hydrolase [Armatimonadota bacterium]|nr:serine hydrolase [Armatimonadota bacterium]